MSIVTNPKLVNNELPAIVFEDNGSTGKAVMNMLAKYKVLSLDFTDKSYINSYDKIEHIDKTSIPLYYGYSNINTYGINEEVDNEYSSMVNNIGYGKEAKITHPTTLYMDNSYLKTNTISRSLGNSINLDKIGDDKVLYTNRNDINNDTYLTTWKYGKFTKEYTLNSSGDTLPTNGDHVEQQPDNKKYYAIGTSNNVKTLNELDEVNHYNITNNSVVSNIGYSKLYQPTTSSSEATANDTTTQTNNSNNSNVNKTSNPTTTAETDNVSNDNSEGSAG